MTAWKFLDYKGNQIRSRHGSTTWTTGEWQHVDGNIRACSNGFHSSERISDAFGYVSGSVLAEVETASDSDVTSDKAAHRSMRIVKAYRWTKNDSVALAIYAAELVIDVFESARPGDDRPRKAIEAAKAYLGNPSDAAAYPSDAAAYAAYAAARAAARAAAVDAASAAARAAVKDKIEAWMVARVGLLGVIS